MPARAPIGAEAWLCSRLFSLALTLLPAPPHTHAAQRELAAALPDGVLHPRHRFVDYQETAEGVSVQFEGPEGPASVEAALLVGCDGSQSLVREQLLGDGPPAYLGKRTWVG